MFDVFVDVSGWIKVRNILRTKSKDIFNWADSRARIGWEICSNRVQTMEITSWWRNLFFSFSRARFSEELQRKWTPKTGKVIVRNQLTTIFYGLYSYRQKKWRQNVQNFAMKPRLLVPLEFWTLWRHFHGKITDHGLLKPACNMTQNAIIGTR